MAQQRPVVSQGHQRRSRSLSPPASVSPPISQPRTSPPSPNLREMQMGIPHPPQPPQPFRSTASRGASAPPCPPPTLQQLALRHLTPASHTLQLTNENSGSTDQPQISQSETAGGSMPQQPRRILGRKTGTSCCELRRAAKAALSKIKNRTPVTEDHYFDPPNFTGDKGRLFKTRGDHSNNMSVGSNANNGNGKPVRQTTASQSSTPQQCEAIGSNGSSTSLSSDVDIALQLMLLQQDNRDDGASVQESEGSANSNTSLNGSVHVRQRSIETGNQPPLPLSAPNSTNQTDCKRQEEIAASHLKAWTEMALATVLRSGVQNFSLTTEEMSKMEEIAAMGQRLAEAQALRSMDQMATEILQQQLPSECTEQTENTRDEEITYHLSEVRVKHLKKVAQEMQAIVEEILQHPHKAEYEPEAAHAMRQDTIQKQEEKFTTDRLVASEQQIKELESQIKDIRSTVERLALTQEEMEDVVIKRCWLSYHWGLAVKYDLLRNTAKRRHDRWSEVAPVPLEVVLSYGDKAMDSLKNQGKVNIGHRRKLNLSNIRMSLDIESVLSVERGLQELAALKVEDAVLLEMNRQRNQNSLKRGNAELSQDEANDIRFKRAWLAHFWGRAVMYGVEEAIAREHLVRWITRSTLRPTLLELSDVNQAILELRELEIQEKLWDATRTEMGQCHPRPSRGGGSRSA